MPLAWTQPSPFLFAGLACAGLAIWLSWRAARARSRRQLLQDLPTSPAAAIFVGWLEASGRARSASPLTSPLGQVPCVLYRLSITESYQRTETEMSRDAKGRTTMRTRVVTGWESVGERTERIPFELEDESGRVRVDPEGARTRTEPFVQRIVGSSEPDYHRFSDQGPVQGSTGQRQLSEAGIRLGADLHLVGRGRPTSSGDDIEIGFEKLPGSGSAEGWQGIAVGDAKAVERWAGSGSWSGQIFAWILTVAATYFFARIFNLGPSGQGWRAGLVWIGIGAVVHSLGAGILWLLFTYNGFIDLASRARRAVARIDVELDRRAKLIPRLVAVVEEAGRHEREVQVLLAELRSQGQATTEGQAGVDPVRISGRAALLVERYPELESDELFGNLQAEVVLTEDRIGHARGYLNELTTSWRTRRQRFPENVLFAWMNRRPAGYRAAEAFERAAPAVGESLREGQTS